MNVNKNTVYYVNLGVFVLLAAYSLLLSLNAFDFANIDMNAGLCAVIVLMVIALLMYVVQTTKIAMVLYSMPLAKITLEIVSVLIFLTLACVIRMYCVDEFELYIAREGIVLGCMFIAYLIARMLNQFGFITLLVLLPWPFMISTYNLEMSQLIAMIEMMAVVLVVTFILYMVRHQKKLKTTMMCVFAVAVVGVLAYVMNAQGNQIVQVANPMQYISMYESLFEFVEIERFYYIGIITAAIIGAARMLLGRASGNSLVAFAASAGFVTMTVCGIGGQYMYIMYLVLAIVASGACGTRPAYMDEEVQLNDNMEGVKVKSNKGEKVELLDDSELDKMLDELEGSKPYGKSGSPFNPVKFASDNADEEVPIELQMYDFNTGTPAEAAPVKEEKAESVPEVAVPVVSEPVAEVAEVPAPVEAEPVVEVAEVAAPVVEEPVAEVTAPVVEEPVAEVTAPAVEEVVEVIEEVVIEDAVVTEVVEDVVETPVMEDVGSLTSSEEFSMPTFEMDTVSFANENAELEKEPEVVPEMSVEIIEEVSMDEPVQLVVTDESAESIATSEEFSMPTFEMDTVSLDNVTEIFEEKATSEVIEEAVEIVEEQVEEVKEELIVTTEDVGSIAMAEEFSMPTFEMSSANENVDVIEEIVAEQVNDTVAEVEQAVSETVEEEPVVLVQNPIFIKNPIDFNRTRTYDTQTEENKNYGFEISAPTFETMGSFLADNKEADFPQFETAQSAMDDFMSSFVTDESEKESEPVEETVQEEVVDKEEFSTIENIALDVSDDEDDVIEVNADNDVAGEIFEYASESAGHIDDIEMPGFMSSDFDSADLFGTFSPDSEDDEDDLEETSSNTMIVEPETVELGLDLDEDFSFGQAQSLTDWYDYGSTPQVLEFDEPEVGDVEETEIVEEAVEEAEVAEQVIEESVVEMVPVNVTEEVVASAEEIIEEVIPKEFDVNTEYTYDYDYDEEEVEVETEAIASFKDNDVYDWDAADVKYEYTEEGEATDNAVAEPVKAADSDYFDWSSYDEYDYDEEEKQETVENVEFKAVAGNNSFEEFVWTDEMIKAMEAGEDIETAAKDIVEEVATQTENVVEEVQQAVEEVAVSMEYDYSSDEPDQYEVFQSSGDFVPEVEEVVEETQYEVFQSSGNFVPEVEEVVEETQYEVFQSSGNFVPEVEEVVEETQYEVFQSSGNFVPEVEEVVEETQYEVFQSSGNFVSEVEEVVEEIQYKTYGQEEEAEGMASKNDSNDDFESPKTGIDFPDFDLDLPGF